MKERIEIRNPEELPDNRKGLYRVLSAIRNRFANKKNKPSYYIFHNRTLMRMCLELPETPDEMLKIPGVTYYKYNEYGKFFLEEIKRFTQSTGMKPDDSYTVIMSDSVSSADRSNTELKIKYSGLISLYNFVFIYNSAVKESGTKEIATVNATELFRYLELNGYAYMDIRNGVSNRCITDKGRSYGLEEAMCFSRNGTEYTDIFLNEAAQRSLSEYCRHI